MDKHGTHNKGFTLLLAALVASIVLALGTSIYEIAQKQVMLSSIGRDSQFAFYAADTAAECALYWDFRFSYFATTPPSSISPTCDGQSLLPLTESSGKTQPYSYPYTLTTQQVNLFSATTPGGGFCVQVSIEKCDGPIAQDGTCTHVIPAVVHTRINADGYNVSCATVSTAPQALQRTVELRY